MQPWVLRLAPGNDLLEALEDARKAQGWTAVFVTAGIGSLHAAPLRFAGQLTLRAGSVHSKRLRKDDSCSRIGQRS